MNGSIPTWLKRRPKEIYDENSLSYLFWSSLQAHWLMLDPSP